MNVTYLNPYQPCPSCRGFGVGLNAYTGEPGNCWTCHGYGTIRSRDSQGRFVGNIAKMTSTDKLEEFYPDLGDELVGALWLALSEPLDDPQFDDMDEETKRRVREAGF
jgi:hypothetical protein